MKQELEAQLRENPDDEATWLVYRDYLIEHKNVRRGELVGSDRELTEKQRNRYRGAATPKSIVRWKHGWVVAIELPIDPRTPRLLRHIFANDDGRLISSLRLKGPEYGDDAYFGKDDRAEDMDNVLYEILRMEELRQLRAFSLAYYSPSPPLHIERLARGPVTLAVTALDLRYCGITDELAGELVEAAEYMRSVRRLYLQGNPLGDIGARRLAGWWNDLDEVDVRYTNISADGARAFRARRVLADHEAGTLTTTPRSRVARIVPADGGYTTELVDPHTLTLRTLENIIPLDERIGPLDLWLADHVELAHEVHRFALGGVVPALDDLPLYTTPLNAASRGGKRYIFHSAHLAAALTKALRTALPLPGFSHVNPVFRCNRFEPGDDDFHSHLDTPYFDVVRKHVSKYTLLIYLTGGTGEPALEIENVAIRSIDAMTAVVFHQAYAHAGRAYAAGRKVFLRTELVFEDDKLAHDPQIAAAFSRACYLTGESLCAPELARDADALYNQVAAAHWGAAIVTKNEPVLHKRFRDIHWLANGYDFWFSRSLPLADCAAITLLDYFNCTLEGEPFRARCTSDVIRDNVDPDAFLADHTCSPLPALDMQVLFPAPEGNVTCCPTHARTRYDPTVSEEVSGLYANAQRFACERIARSPVVMLGQDVYLNRERFLVEGNVLHVLCRERLAPVNFAACWNSNGTPPNFLDVDVSIGVFHPLVPPILWTATRATHHLMFDFFRNDWTVQHEHYAVPVPRIRRVDADTVDENDQPWLAAAQDARPDASAPRLGAPPFWAHYTQHSALMRDLYRKR